MAVEKIQVPDLGDAEEVEVIEILVAVGDEVSENDSLLVLETDKAAMEIPAPKAGVVKEILVKVGDQVSKGSDIIVVETAGESASSAPAAPEAAEATPEAAEVAPETPAEAAPVVEEPAPAAAPVAAAATQSSVQEILVPDLGDDTDVEVIEILVAVGDEVNAEDGLITLETDKAAMDVPAPMAGKVSAIKLKVGDKVSQGTLILTLETTAAATTPSAAAPVPAPAPSTPVVETPPAASAPVVEAPSTPVPAPAPIGTASEVPATPAASGDSEVYAGPAVRKLARQLGVELTQVTGTGTKSRIIKEDVHAFVKNKIQTGVDAVPASGAGLPAVPDADYSKFGEIEEIAMSKLHQVTSQNMTRNWLNVPHVTQFEEADVTDMEEFRAAQKKLAEKKGIKLTPVPFIIKACAQALAEYPQFNVSLHSSGKKLIQKKYINIGVAVATPAGLMVPVIKNVDQKSIWEISAELAELGAKAKDRKLSREEMEGGCFTISSLGGIGGTGFTPIVNAPEVAILGVSKTSIKPVYIDGEFVPRKMMPYSLSYDHRAVNGLDGGMFCTYLTALLSDIRMMVL